jgi:outer membrane protein assembly factor BamB
MQKTLIWTRMIWLCLYLSGLVACSTPTPSVSESKPTPPIITIIPTSVPSDSNSNVTLYRGDSQRTGVYNTPAIRNQPEVKWQTEVSSSWLMPPIIADGILYTGSGDGVLYALNAETGEQIWSVGGFEAFESTGAIAGNLIVAGGFSNVVKALDKNTGEEVWSFQTDYFPQGSPLIVDESVYIATDHVVYALDLQSGELIWKVQTGDESAFMGSPDYYEGVIYTTGGKLLLALDSETGEELAS